jgi:cytochrome P450
VAQATDEIELRRQQPRDDLFSYLVNGEFLDRKLRQDEIMEIAVNLFVAGFHTTSAAFSSAIMHFDAFPEDRKAIIHNPELLPKAIEEINRVYSPVTAMARTLKQDITMNGITLKSGEKALLSIMAANRDPEAFPHPDVVDVTDDAKNSLAWGWGIHRCLGIHLARMVLRIELETVLELMPDYVIDREHVRLVPDVGISYLYATIPASIPGDSA